MRLVLHGVESGKYPNLRTHIPDDPEVFDDFVQVLIGRKPGKGGDGFTLRVATPAGLAASGEPELIAQSPLLVIRRFDYDTLWSWLERTVAACEAPTWDESVERLRRHFRWEFDYARK
ncbi:Imm8 family immunity protein [Nocardia bovistercoris]|uniref:Immunity protein 8 of polymorphic toxin system n=1 Tax=Nocardia bovistercoris TaxID=2785916 RepID=A0A931IAR1_9NOCA|nr:Imm8 family immunity protein [Nocardia bovistercoris]MBH0776403.1 hypothetical protein [Nocardia bovistercoris]